MIIIITGNEHCLSFQNITYRESCGNNILTLPLKPDIYQYPTEEFKLIKGIYLYGGSILNDILLKKTWTLIDIFNYNYFEDHLLTFGGFTSIINQDDQFLLDYLSESKNKSTNTENNDLYQLVNKNLIGYETIVTINNEIYNSNQFHKIYNEKGNYTIKLLGKTIRGTACSCPNLGNGFKYGRFLTGWIVNENNRNHIIEMKNINEKYK